MPLAAARQVFITVGMVEEEANQDNISKMESPSDSAVILPSTPQPVPIYHQPIQVVQESNL